MNNLNRVIVNGNLTNDCKCEYGKSGTAYGGFCIAVNSSEKKGDNWEDVTSFFEVKAFGKLFESQQLVAVVFVLLLSGGDLGRQTAC